MIKPQFSNKFKIIFLFSAILLLAVSCNPLARQQVQQPAPSLAPTTTTPEDKPAQQSFFYDGIQGESAMALLKEMHKVETKDFGKDLGEFVESINGIKPQSDEFWAFYVNGKSSDVGASQYITKDGDKIEWRLDKVENY